MERGRAGDEPLTDGTVDSKDEHAGRGIAIEVSWTVPSVEVSWTVLSVLRNRTTYDRSRALAPTAAPNATLPAATLAA